MGENEEFKQCGGLLFLTVLENVKAEHDTVRCRFKDQSKKPKGFFVRKAIDRGQGDPENWNGDILVNLDVMRWSQNAESF